MIALEFEKIKLGLKRGSWENLFEVIRNQPNLEAAGNLWATIQHLESQLSEIISEDNGPKSIIKSKRQITREQDELKLAQLEDELRLALNNEQWDKACEHRKLAIKISNDKNKTANSLAPPPPKKIMCECCRRKEATVKDHRQIPSIGCQGKVLVCNYCSQLCDVEFADEYTKQL